MLDMSFLPKKLQQEILIHQGLLILSRGVRIVQPYDLRTPQAVKHEDTIDSNDWTAFVNRKVSLVHVMRRGCEHALIRIPLGKCKYQNLEAFIKKMLYEEIL